MPAPSRTKPTGSRAVLDGVVVVANAPLRVPADPLVELVARLVSAADDWIAEQAGPGDIVVTADIPLAARCLTSGAHVLDPKGRRFTDNDIGSALAMRTGWTSCGKVER